MPDIYEEREQHSSAFFQYKTRFWFKLEKNLHSCFHRLESGSRFTWWFFRAGHTGKVKICKSLWQCWKDRTTKSWLEAQKVDDLGDCTADVQSWIKQAKFKAPDLTFKFFLYLVVTWQSTSMKQSVKRVTLREQLPSFPGRKQATGRYEKTIYEATPASSFFHCEFWVVLRSKHQFKFGGT